MAEPAERSPAPAETGGPGRIELGATEPIAPELRGASGRAQRTRDQATRRVEDLRHQSTLVDAALEAGGLDRRRAGSLLAGGIAFRIFLWLLPAALFVAALVGLVRPTGGASPPRPPPSLRPAPPVARTGEQAPPRSHPGAATPPALPAAPMVYTPISPVPA